MNHTCACFTQCTQMATCPTVVHISLCVGAQHVTTAHWCCCHTAATLRCADEAHIGVVHQCAQSTRIAKPLPMRGVACALACKVARDNAKDGMAEVGAGAVALS